MSPSEWTFLLILLCILWIPGWYAVRRLRVRKKTRMIRALLETESFFHSLLLGASNSIPWDVEGKELYTDAKYTVVFQKGGKPVAVLGFDLTKNALQVRQMQGLRGVNLKGMQLGPTLIPLAERIARGLGKRVLWVQAAQRHWYFERPSLEAKGLFEELRRHKVRMVATYNDASLALGLEPDMQLHFLRGHRKVFRKKITWRRALRLRVLLFNRALKRTQSLWNSGADN